MPTHDPPKVGSTPFDRLLFARRPRCLRDHIEPAAALVNKSNFSAATPLKAAFKSLTLLSDQQGAVDVTFNDTTATTTDHVELYPLAPHTSFSTNQIRYRPAA